jgi:hypothetical protein
MISRSYLNYYRSHAPEAARLLNTFLPVVAAAKLNDNILPEQLEIKKLVR